MGLVIGVNVFSQAQTSPQKEQNQVVTSKKAEFPGGENAYRNELYKYINGYIDMSKYAANGVFVFSFDVDTDGKTKNLSVTPRVKNSELFIEDMLFCMKRVKTAFL